MSDEGAELQLVIPGDALAVRQALQAMVEALTLRGLHACDRGTAEIVLAEVLNNIVEHAFEGRAGEIEVKNLYWVITIIPTNPKPFLILV